MQSCKKKNLPAVCCISLPGYPILEFFTTTTAQLGNTFICCSFCHIATTIVVEPTKVEREKKGETHKINATLDGTLSSHWRADQHKFLTFSKASRTKRCICNRRTNCRTRPVALQMWSHCPRAVKSLSGAQGLCYSLRLQQLDT